MKIHLNRAALDQVLNRAETDHARRDLAETIASRARAMPIEVGSVGASVEATVNLPIIVSDHASVILAHPAGLAAEAKYGVLIKAAAEVGRQVKS